MGKVREEEEGSGGVREREGCGGGVQGCGGGDCGFNEETMSLEESRRMV